MPALRGPGGKVIYVRDDEVSRYTAGGDYALVSESAAGAAQSAIAPEDTGAVGSVRAGLSALASGATLGATDWILKGVQTEGQTEQLAAERAANPIISGLGQAAGMILPAIVTGGAATPSGYLSKLAMEGVEAGRAAGGATGVAQALGAAGAEGAIQNAGIYLSDVALGDRQLTAEGVTGALGTGFAFGAGGLAAMHGIEAGTIAARRMFARYAEGGERAAQDAAHQWSTQSAAQLEAFDQTAEMARARLAQAEAARAQAGLAREQAAAGLAESRVPVAPEAMPPLPDMPPDARVALLLRERAHQMTPEAKAAWDAKFGPELHAAIAENPTARKTFTSPAATGPEAIAPAELEQAMRVHGTGPTGESSAMPPRTDAVHGASGPVGSFEDLQKLARDLEEYDAARRSFNEVRARVDPDLEAALHDLGELNVQAEPVPLGEFGAPGQRAFKSQEELARLAAGTPAEPAAAAQATGAARPQALRGQSLGEIAAEQAPIEVGKPRLQQGLPSRARATPEGPKPDVRGMYASVRRGRGLAEGPAGSQQAAHQPAVDLSEGDLPNGFTLRKMNEGGVRENPEDVTLTEGIPQREELSRDSWRDHAYVVRPSELMGRGLRGIESGADMLADARTTDVRSAWARGERVPALEIHVTKNNKLFIADGNHRLLAAALEGDRPILAHFKPIELNVKTMDPMDDLLGRALQRGRGVRPSGPAEVPRPSAPTPAVATASAPPGGMGSPSGWVEVVRVGKPSAGTFEAMAADGSVTPLTKAEMRDWVERQMPEGFHAGGLETHRDFAIERRIPNSPGEIHKNAVYVVRPSELADRGILGNRIRPDDLDRVTSDLAAGKRLAPIRVDMAPDGELWVNDGNHRLLARAADGDKPVVVELRASAAKRVRGEAVDPNVDISDRLRAAIANGRPPPDSSGDLLTALRGTSAQLGEGRTIGEIGATSPARAEYVAAKEARTAAAAEHFRGKANAENYARSEMAAVERAAQPPAGSDAAAAFKLEDAGLLPRAEPSEALTAVRARPAAVRQLEAAQDAALERAATATDPAVRTAAKREAAAIEEQLTRLEKRPGIVEDISAMAEAATRVEKAAAVITESVGDAAPAAAKEHAKAFRAAEEAADHKMTSRIARAADDHAAGGADLVNGPSAGEQRIAAAKRAKLEADAAFARAKAVETEARMGADAAAKQAADLRATMPDAAAPSTRPSGGMARKVAEGARTVGVAAELASDFGIPGVPRPHDIPVIGPLLSVYLKYRALRAAAGRFVGRVPATAETRAAALAARTKDTMARAVDRSMGLIERNPASVRVAATATGLAVTAALSRRALDDGEPDAPKGATVQQQAAVRIREVAAAATNPQLIADKVRAETRGILDPDLIDAMENHLMAMYKHLADVAPKLPPPNPYTKTQPVPSTAAAMRFGRQLAVANNPNVAFEALHTRTLTPDMAETLRVCYAKLFAMAQRRLVERAADLKHPVEYRQLMQNAVLFDVPLHASLHPENIAVLATAHAPPPQEQPTAGPGGPPAPSIANPTNTSQIYQTTADRRAQQR